MLGEERKHDAASRTEDETGRSSQRERLFKAALTVALDRGFGHVTLDAVARQAGVSKGGLLYHFESKSELIKAMLARYAEPPEGEVCSKGRSCAFDPLAISVLIAAAENPSLLRAIEDRLHPVLAGKGTQYNRMLTGNLANRLAL